MSKNIIYSEACNKVAGFQKMGEEFIRKLVINNRARSTHENYLRQMSKLALHYNRTPLDIEIGELEEYLYHLIQKDTDSLSSFKHLVYGLRKLYQLFDREELVLSLPSINRPVDRSIFGNLRIKKDRYVPMSSHAVRGIKKHLTLNSPQDYLFESHNRKGMPLSHTRIRCLFKDALEKSGIRKKACVHTLRHTYATHQLEAGQNIMVLKDLLGHSNIQTTLIYLHVA